MISIIRYSKASLYIFLESKLFPRSLTEDCNLAYNSSMKVALVHDYLREYGGAERVLEAIHELYPEADVYTAYYFPEKMPERMKSWKIQTSALQKLPFLRNHFLWYTYLVPWAFEQFDLRKYDLVIASSSFAAKGVLTYPNQTYICYCHTPTRFLWGVNAKSNRRWLIRPILNRLNSFFKKWDYSAAQRVDYFVANSRTTQARIKEYYNRDSDVIYPFGGFDSPTDVNTKRDYYLVLSRLEVIKRIDVIIKAFNELGLPLKIGGTGFMKDKLKSIAGPTVEFIGFVPEEKLAAVYSGAKAFVACADDEDFGMTLVEAQMCGTPVVALRQGGYIESVEENATGLFFEKATTEEIVQTIKEFETRLFNPEKIRQQAQKFSKENFKQSFMDLVAKKLKSAS